MKTENEKDQHEDKIGRKIKYLLLWHSQASFKCSSY